jgi:hypothetical protein
MRNQVWQRLAGELGQWRAAGQPSQALVSISWQRQAALGDHSREAFGGEAGPRTRSGHSRAANFFRTVAGSHRELDDRWSLARSLSNIANTLDRDDGPSQQARTHREQALQLLADFDDPRAAALRQRIIESLGAPQPEVS